LLNAAIINEAILPIQFIFCDYLNQNEVICHYNKYQTWAMVSDDLRNNKAELVKIKYQILKRLRQ
jgi:hypothetical protein